MDAISIAYKDLNHAVKHSGFAIKLLKIPKKATRKTATLAFRVMQVSADKQRNLIGAPVWGK